MSTPNAQNESAISDEDDADDDDDECVDLLLCLVQVCMDIYMNNVVLIFLQLCLLNLCCWFTCFHV